jgi:proline-specific peptidase
VSHFRFDGRQVWFSVVGELGGKPPLICVPGGPGAAHIYLKPMAGVAQLGRPVVFYDPLASGKSEFTERSDWSLEIYTEELAALIEALAVPRYHLFAHSAAALPVYTFAVRRPPGLAGLVMASCPASIPDYHAAMRARLALGAEALERFEKAERNELPRDVEYLKIADRFLKMVLRQKPPADFMRGAEGSTNGKAHRAIKGGSCFYTTALATWDITPHLGDIAAKTLITCGRYDTVSPAMSSAIQARIPGAELAVFENSAHMPHIEEPALYIERVAQFLDRCD